MPASKSSKPPKTTKKKVTPKAVYLLLGFPAPYIKAQKAHIPLEKMRAKAHELKKKGKKNVKLEEQVKTLGEEYNKTHLFNLAGGTQLKGIFNTKKAAVDIVLKYGYDLHEGGYYTYFAVEKWFIGFDSPDYNEPEVWLKGRATGKTFWNYKYEICARPKELKGVKIFA